MVASTLTAKGPCSPTNCFILGSSVLLPYIKKRNIYSKVIQKESTTYWKKTWPDWLWSISMTQCGTLFQVALSGQNCDLASWPWNSNRRQTKWWKTMEDRLKLWQKWEQSQTQLKMSMWDHLAAMDHHPKRSLSKPHEL